MGTTLRPAALAERLRVEGKLEDHQADVIVDEFVAQVAFVAPRRAVNFLPRLPHDDLLMLFMLKAADQEMAMPIYSEERLPLPVYAEAGSSIPLTQVLTQAFGDGWTQWTNFWFRSFSAETLSSWNFGYWDAQKPMPASWTSAGKSLPVYGVADTFLKTGELGSVNLVAGNSITDTTVFLVETTAPSATDRSFTWYHIKIVDDQFQGLNRALPVATDVVNAAIAMDAKYRMVPNSNDCGWITDAVGSAAGAVLPASDQSIIPTENREGGFWRIAHRGSDNPTKDWEASLNRAGFVGGSNS